MLLDDKINALQIETKQKITYKKIAEVLGLGSGQAVQNRITRKQELKEWEELLLDDYFLNNNINNQSVTNKTSKIKKYDIIEIDYWEFTPEEMKNPKYPFVIAQRSSIEEWGKKLCIVAMNGDKMADYWYKIRNNDVLIIDLNETRVNANGSGVYFATSRNNSKFWIREMTELIDDGIEFKAYAPSGQTVRQLTKHQLQEADFKIIGKVIKNVSFTL